MKIYIFFITVFLISSNRAISEDKPIKIGMIAGLTGGAADFGKASVLGARFAIDQLPKEIKERVKLFIEDDGLDNKKSALAFNKLVDTHKVDAIIGTFSGGGKTVSPLASRAKIPFLSIASDPAISMNNCCSFNIWVSPERETRLLLNEIKKRGYKSVGIISSIQDGALAARDSFLDQSKGEVQVAYDIEIPMDELDLKSYALKVKSITQPDVIIIALFPNQAGIFTKLLKDFHVTAPFFAYEMIEDENVIKASNGALEGALIATIANANESFINDINKFAKENNAYRITAPPGYDAVKILVAALDQSHQSSVDYIKELKNFSGISSAISHEEGWLTQPAILKIVKGNMFPEYKHN